MSTSGEISWQSPSNIAIVKYWGKHGVQLPRNCSLSFTLSKAHTQTTLGFVEKADFSKDIDLTFMFEGQRNADFGKKSKIFMESLLDSVPWLAKYKFSINTFNTFPHSSGIASSASGMSALACCIAELEMLENGSEFKEGLQFRKRASYLSRLGSGSACRSVYPTMACWGFHPEIEDSSDEEATYVGGLVNPIFQSYHDDILIVSKSEKSVSSSAGHQLMDNNPFANPRYQQANDNISRLLQALKDGDVHAFGLIAEDEALTLHALMMCSTPSYILMEPNTLVMIKLIRAFRLDTGLPLYFTLDAGPNIHLLYPNNIEAQVWPWIYENLVPLCENKMVIRDQVGTGAVKI